MTVLDFKDRLSILRMAFSKGPTASSASAWRKFMPMLGEPPRRDASMWFDLYNKSPRMNPIHQIASDVATSAYRMYVKGDEQKEPVDNPLVDLLKRPNPDITITEYVLFYITQVYLLLPSGEAFWLKERNGYGQVKEIWPIPPDWVAEIPSLKNPYFKIYPMGNVTGKPLPVLEKDMVYFKRPDVGNPYSRGVGRSEGVGDEIETDEYMAKYTKRFFFNNAIPEMVGMMPGADETQVDRQTEKWNQKYGGYNNSHKTAWLNWDAKIQILKETYREMDFVNSRKYLRDLTNQHFNIPPELFGILENSNRSTIDAAYYLYTKNVLRKELKFLDDTINLQLVPDFASNLRYEHDNVVPEDEEFILKRTTEGLKYGGTLIDEWRRKNGFEPLPNGLGQTLLVPLNMIALQMNGNILSLNDDPNAVGAPPKSLSKAKDAALWQLFDASLVKMERKMNEVMKGYFAETNKRLTMGLEKGFKQVTENPDELVNWDELVVYFLSTASPVWFMSIREGFEVAKETFGYRIDFEIYQNKMLQWLQEYGVNEVKYINDTTKEMLRSTLSEGIINNESIAELKNRVTKVMGDDSRSKAIATTEAHSAMQYGMFEAYKAAGMTQKKWLTVMDGRERPSHGAINGYVTGIDQPFPNGLMYPGDPNGSAGELVNCRCSMIGISVEGEV